jgi:hypothetical protein
LQRARFRRASDTDGRDIARKKRPCAPPPQEEEIEMKRRLFLALRLIALFGAAGALSGCAVYPAGYASYTSPGYGYYGYGRPSYRSYGGYGYGYGRPSWGYGGYRGHYGRPWGYGGYRGHYGRPYW